MLFIEALANTMLVMVAMAAVFAWAFARLDWVVEVVGRRVAAQDARSLDDDLREL